ncbi:MAG: hypothetical protein Q4B69_02650 [Slackia sp.]|nr:hypothetical protein [Slackia sp.]
MRNKLIAIASGALLSACLAGCTPAEVRETQTAIDAIGEVTLDSQDAITEANAKYDALSEELKEQVENHPALEAANERIAEILHSEIEVQIGKADELGFDYFSRYYDMNKVESAKTAAQEAIESSNEDEYANVYYALKNANREFAAYIDEERANSYSAPTNDGDHPFAVNAEEFPQNGSLRPLTKLDSSYPLEVSLAEPKTADGLPYLAYIMSDSNGNFNRVYSYNYEIKEIETVEINVQDGSGEIKRAFVNSQLVLSHFNGGSPDETHAKFQNQSYLLKTASGELALVIPDLKGGDFYIPYVL